MAMADDERYMRQAPEVATEEGDHPSKTPIGCVIVFEGVVIAAAAACSRLSVPVSTISSTTIRLPRNRETSNLALTDCGWRFAG
jgi:hypothetical protein